VGQFSAVRAPRRHLGARLSCYNGAIRIYWPGLTANSDPLQHPLYLPGRVRDIEQQGARMSELLLRRLAAISAVRFVEGALTRSVRVALQDEERERLRSGRAEHDEIFQELERAWDRQKMLEQERDAEQQRTLELEIRVADLEDELRDLKRNFAEISAHAARAAAGGDIRESEPELEPRTVREALDLAEAEFSEYLDIWPSARDSANRSDFARPAQVYRALAAVKEVAESYFRSRTDGLAMGPWEAAFSDRGFDYAAHEHQTTITMYGAERTFSNADRRLRMEKHLTLGGGSRQNCLQIYFEIDEAQRRFVIGYCGMHLRYAAMAT